MKCNRCQYEWETRTDKPKNCPRCKQRLEDANTITIKLNGERTVLQFPTQQAAAEAMKYIEELYNAKYKPQ